MIIDDRIESYTEMIRQEENPVFKMLYELNRGLLIKLKNHNGQNNELNWPVSSENKEGVEEYLPASF